jgi:hypothetical protein
VFVTSNPIVLVDPDGKAPVGYHSDPSRSFDQDIAVYKQFDAIERMRASKPGTPEFAKAKLDLQNANQQELDADADSNLLEAVAPVMITAITAPVIAVGTTAVLAAAPPAVGLLVAGAGTLDASMRVTEGVTGTESNVDISLDGITVTTRSMSDSERAAAVIGGGSELLLGGALGAHALKGRSKASGSGRRKSSAQKEDLSQGSETVDDALRMKDQPLNEMPSVDSKSGELVNPKKLVPSHRPDEVSQSKVDRLRKKMKTMGYDEAYPIDYAEVDGRMIITDGHHRAEAAVKAKLPSVPVNRVEVSQSQADELALSAAEAAQARQIRRSH